MKANGFVRTIDININNPLKEEKRLISASMKLSKDVIDKAEMNMSQIEDDFINGQLTANIISFFRYALAKERKATYYFCRPTFLDWLLRREYKISFIIKMEEVLNKDKNEIIYEIEKI